MGNKPSNQRIGSVRALHLSKDVGSGSGQLSTVSHQANSSPVQIGANSSGNGEERFEGKIVVVSRGQQARQLHPEEMLAERINSLSFRPLIPIGFESVPSNYEQINYVPFSNICRLMQKLMRVKAEAVHKEQQQLTQIIKEVEFAAAFLTNQFVEREKRLNKVLEAFSRMNQIVSGVETCEKQMQDCAETINKLNQSLPVQDRLETLQIGPHSR